MDLMDAEGAILSRQGREAEPGLLGEDGSGLRYLQLGGAEHGGRLFVESPQVGPLHAICWSLLPSWQHHHVLAPR